MNTDRVRRLRFLAPTLLVLVFFGCTSLHLEDCPDNAVLGEDKPRIRSWRVRMLLADEAAAAARLADYAAMSAYAYVEPADQDCGKAPKLEPVEIQRLREWLSSAGWERVMAAEFVPPCEDDVGLFYHAWKRETAEKTEVVLSFRGTWGFKDWWYGNSYWFRRFSRRTINMPGRGPTRKKPCGISRSKELRARP